MKQFRITTENSGPIDSNDDCVLPPNDPVHEIKRLQYLGGLGSEARLHEYRAEVNRHNKAINNGSNISLTGNEKAELMKKNDIRPGTPEWFKLWFSRPYMTGEKPVGD
jgi:hypothetical protein